MHSLAHTFLLLMAGCVAAGAGTITGVVRAEGKGGAAEQGRSGKYESRKFKFAERVNYQEMRDFVVFVDLKPTNTPAAPARPLQVITQKDAVFRPHVLPVVAGTIVEWPNKDEILHNVFSISEAKPFDLGLYREPDVRQVTFDKCGRVDVFCSIHAKMNCVILVLENPWFAAADAAGRYTITNVPPGKYKLKAWHERMPAQVQEVIVPEAGEARVDFVLGIMNLPKY